MRFFVFILFLLSGACGLIYEVAWSRVMTEIIGSTVIAVGTVLAAFMSGLALGSYLIGRRGDTSSNPLRLYAYLEFGIGLSALIAQLLMDRTGTIYLWLHQAFGGSALALAAVRFAIAFGLVLLPTVLMGATLPVLSRFVITRLSSVGSNLGTLYAINTLGAVGGSLAAGFYLIGTIGIHRTVCLAVACNIAIGLAAWALSGRYSVETPREQPREVREESGGGEEIDRVYGPGHRLLLWSFGLSGFASFAYEIFWTRALVHLLGNSTYAFTMMLTAFLSGIALGGFLVRYAVDRLGHRMRWFAAIQILIGATSAAALPLLFRIVESESIKSFVREMSDELGLVMLSRFVVALLVMLVPATLIGATFPLVGSIYVKSLRQTSADVGKIYAVNTLGNVLGALAPGFVLLPVFGVQKGVLFLAALNAAIGLFILLTGSKRTTPLRFAVPVIFVAFATLLPRVELDFQFPSQSQAPADRVLFYREGLSGTTKVFLEPNTGHKRMSIDGIIIGGTEFTDYKQQVLAHFPKLLLEEFDSELSIGLGSGILIGESLRHQSLKRLVCIEIEPSVLEGAKRFEQENYGVLGEARVRIVIDDAGNFLRTTSDKFDIISADEKTADQYASNGFSYSFDYYTQLKHHLTERGLIIQWIPNHLPSSQYRMVLKTFADAFPHVTVWYFPAVGKGGPTNTFVVGSLRELRIDAARMNEALASGSPAFDGLRKYGLETAESLLAHYVARGPAVSAALPDAPHNTLENPYYEFYSPAEYAKSLNKRILHNDETLKDLRASEGWRGLEQLVIPPVTDRLRQAFQAEDLFLSGMKAQLMLLPHPEIVPLFQTAVEQAPWNLNLRAQVQSYYWNKAGVLYLEGNYREALLLMRLAAEVLPSVGEVRYYHGLTLLQTGDRTRAVEEMRQAIALEPRLLPPRRILASELLAMGRVQEAVQHLERIVVIDPQDAFALEQLRMAKEASATGP